MSEDLDSSLEETFKCSISACIDDKSHHRLQCGDCKRHVHYRCTMLPAYQIQLFLNKRSPKFICTNCVTIQKDLVDLLKTKDVPFYVITRDKEEIKRLRNELRGCESILKNQSENYNDIKSMLTHLSSKKEIEEILEKERKQLGNDIEECIESKFKKLNENIKESANEAKTYASAVGKKASLRSIMKEAQDEKVQAVMQVAKINDLCEEREREFRATNIIIHGVEETNEDGNAGDENWLKRFQADIGLEFQKKFMNRLGTKKPLSQRPLKIVLKNIEDKKSVFSNLKNLKGKEDYRGISVAEDFTLAERSVIKSWYEKAKERNEKEGFTSNVVWRVRGSPKKGTMHLKKFDISQNSQTN